MSYQFQNELSRIWEKAVLLYRAGNTNAKTFPLEEEMTSLVSWGINKIDVFDYAEEWCLHHEPDLLTFVLVHYERWSYFLEEQNGKTSTERIDPNNLPSRSEKVEGIEWLPRILPKARAKLKGELPEEVMYGCGGDRHFFKTTTSIQLNFFVSPENILKMTTRSSNGYWNEKILLHRHIINQ